MERIDLPTTSARRPERALRHGFQDMIVPLRSLLTMASSEDSTIAAVVRTVRRAMARRRRVRIVSLRCAAFLRHGAPVADPLRVNTSTAARGTGRVSADGPVGRRRSRQRQHPIGLPVDRRCWRSCGARRPSAASATRRSSTTCPRRADSVGRRDRHSTVATGPRSDPRSGHVSVSSRAHVAPRLIGRPSPRRGPAPGHALHVHQQPRDLGEQAHLARVGRLRGARAPRLAPHGPRARAIPAPRGCPPDEGS